MKQAIHIFRKDVRHLWPPLLVAFAMQVLFTFFEMRPHLQPFVVANRFNAETLVDLLLPVGWWYLIIELVHQEPLPGDRQFWVTRPYSWKSLLAAKALFIVVFINLPVLVADNFILRAQGFPVAGNWEALLWRQVPFAIALLAPPLALAALTRNLGQVIIAVLLVILRIVLSSIPFSDLAPGRTAAIGWIDATMSAVALLAVLATVVFIQYRRRLTWLSRTVAAVFLVVPGFSIPMRWQLDWQARVKPPTFDGGKIHFAFDPGRGPRAPRVLVPRLIQVNVTVPVAISGADSDGVGLVSGQARLALVADGRTAWSSDWEGATLDRDNRGYWETIYIPAPVFQTLRGKPVTIRMTAIVTAVRTTEFRLPLETDAVRVPGVGICESRKFDVQVLSLVCRSAFQSALLTRVHADYPGWDAADSRGRREGMIGQLSDSPFPAGLSLSPVQAAPVFTLAAGDLARATGNPGTQLIFESEHPVADFETKFELDPVRLDDYAVALPAN